jgi:hypothetical protein
VYYQYNKILGGTEPYSFTSFEFVSEVFTCPQNNCSLFLTRATIPPFDRQEENASVRADRNPSLLDKARYFRHGPRHVAICPFSIMPPSSKRPQRTRREVNKDIDVPDSSPSRPAKRRKKARRSAEYTGNLLTRDLGRRAHREARPRPHQIATRPIRYPNDR